MSPHLTKAGRTILASSAALIVVGTASTNWPIVLLGECLAVLLAVVYFVRSAQLMAIEEGFVGLVVHHDTAGDRHGGVAGRWSTLDLEVLNLSGLGLHRLQLEPEHGRGLEFDPPVALLPTVRPHQRVRFSVRVTAGAAGRFVLHGFRLRADGLTSVVSVSDYIPCPLPLKFLPAATARRHRVPPVVRRSADILSMGMHPLKQRGFGTDFRELRDHVVGDPFRSIAWKATARTGKLMVREFEDEITANVFVLLDISSTMRGGTPPRTKLAHAIDLIAELAALLSRSQDQIGLITFDEVVYGHIRTGSARSQQRMIIDHLVGLNAIVDPSLTELDDDEVVAELVRYLMVQERLDFRRHDVPQVGPAGEDLYDIELLNYWLGRRLERESDRIGDRCLYAGVLGSTDLTPARRFCQLRGVHIPYRLEARFGAKEMGMVGALECFLEGTRESHFVLLISDLCGLVRTDEIVTALRLVQSRKHRVSVFMPYTPDYVERGRRPAGPRRSSPEAPYERASALLETFRLAERRERARIARAVGALGIPVSAIGPDQSLEALLQRAAGPSRRALGVRQSRV